MHNKILQEHQPFISHLFHIYVFIIILVHLTPYVHIIRYTLLFHRVNTVNWSMEVNVV